MKAEKKRMISIAAALAVAVTAQAGSVDWEITYSIQKKDGTLIGSGATVYLVLEDSCTSIRAAIHDGTFNINTTGVVGSTQTTANSDVMPAVPITHEAIVDNSTTQTFVTLIFNEGDYNGVEGWFRFTCSAEPDTVSLVSFVECPGSPQWEHYVFVPEPTAMALVALGAAAVGLRRRFRK